MGRAYIQNIIVVLFSISLLSACVKDKPTVPDVPAMQPASTHKLYIACEGSLSNGNSSLYLYNYASQTEHGNIYEASNGGAKLGDVLQSITRIGSRLFLCINNSDKIVVLDTASHKQVGTISITKPRYILRISDDKAYVSTLFSNKVYIINPQTMQVTGSIAMPYQNPEAMLLRNGKAYICQWDTACGNVYTVDISTDKLLQTIPINSRAPHGMAVDKGNNLWILSGNVHKGKRAAFTVLKPDDEVLKTMYFADKVDAIKPVCNNAKDAVYFIEVDYSGGTANNGVYKINTTDNTLPQTALIPAQSFQYFWALGIEPNTGNIYIGDPKGFIQKGSVQVYTTDGKQQRSFSVGVGPGNFYFD
jgi:DNA-binding beta-propeller fold protein YncE